MSPWNYPIMSKTFSMAGSDGLHVGNDRIIARWRG